MRKFLGSRGASETAAQGLRVRSALNPFLWLCGIVTPSCLTASGFFVEHPFVLGVLVAFAVLPIAVACGIGIYFAVYRPEKLQSESYQVVHETLQMLTVKATEIHVDPTSLEALTSGMLRRVESDQRRLEP